MYACADGEKVAKLELGSVAWGLTYSIRSERVAG